MYIVDITKVCDSNNQPRKFFYHDFTMLMTHYVDYEDGMGFLRINNISSVVFKSDGKWWIGAAETRERGDFPVIGPFSDHEEALINQKLMAD